MLPEKCSAVEEVPVESFYRFCPLVLSRCVSTTLQFPELKENIRGEEEATFTNALGESVTVKIQDDVSATADLLEKVSLLLNQPPPDVEP